MGRRSTRFSMEQDESSNDEAVAEDDDRQSGKTAGNF